MKFVTDTQLNYFTSLLNNSIFHKKEPQVGSSNYSHNNIYIYGKIYNEAIETHAELNPNDSDNYITKLGRVRQNSSNYAALKLYSKDGMKWTLGTKNDNSNWIVRWIKTQDECDTIVNNIKNFNFSHSQAPTQLTPYKITSQGINTRYITGIITPPPMHLTVAI